MRRCVVCDVSVCLIALVLVVSAGAGTTGKAPPLAKGWTGSFHYTQNEDDGTGNLVTLDATFTIIGRSPRYTPEIGGGHGLYWVRTDAVVTVVDVASPEVPCDKRSVKATWAGSHSAKGIYVTAGVVINGVRTSPGLVHIDSIENLPFKWTETDCRGTRPLPDTPDDITTTHFIRAPHATGSTRIDTTPGAFFSGQNGDGTYTWHLKWCSAPATSLRCDK